jgi:hypothetical protein
MGRSTLFTALLVLGLLVSRPSLAQYEHAHSDELAPAPARTVVPPGYHVERHVRMAPLVTGSILAGLGYTLAVLMGTNGWGPRPCTSDRWLYIPAVGPFASLAAAPDHVTSGPCDDPEGFKHGLQAWSAIFQGVGGVLIVIGVGAPRTDIVADGPKAHARASSRRTLAIVPALAPSAASVAVLGTF